MRSARPFRKAKLVLVCAPPSHSIGSALALISTKTLRVWPCSRCLARPPAFNNTIRAAIIRTPLAAKLDPLRHASTGIFVLRRRYLLDHSLGFRFFGPVPRSIEDLQHHNRSRARTPGVGCSGAQAAVLRHRLSKSCASSVWLRSPRSPRVSPESLQAVTRPTVPARTSSAATMTFSTACPECRAWST